MAPSSFSFCLTFEKKHFVFFCSGLLLVAPPPHPNKVLLDPVHRQQTTNSQTARLTHPCWCSRGWFSAARQRRRIEGTLAGLSFLACEYMVPGQRAERGWIQPVLGGSLQPSLLRGSTSQSTSLSVKSLRVSKWASSRSEPSGLQAFSEHQRRKDEETFCGDENHLHNLRATELNYSKVWLM